MIKKVLKSKLVSLGYGAGFVEGKVRNMTFTVDTSKYTEAELSNRVDIVFYDNPTAEIQRLFLNIEGNSKDKAVFDGQIDVRQKMSAIGSQMTVADYQLDKKLCIVFVNAEAKIKIIFYNPSDDICVRYRNQSYEEVFGEERDQEAADYVGALTAGGRVSSLKAKDIVYILLSEYIIDIIMHENATPKIRICDSANKFAEAITNYYYKYINRKINRIEYVEKEVNIKYLGSGVSSGYISNDPYLTLSEVNNYANFNLSRPTYAWIYEGDRMQDVLLLYIATERFAKTTFKELQETKEDPEFKMEVEKITNKFSTEAGYAISRQYIQGVFKKLNRELICVPTDFIRHYTNDSMEAIEPLRYRFVVIKNRRDFESNLYNSIENNINGRYKYRFVEKLSGIYLTIGNKLNYTDLQGKLVKKQSIADFNINFNAAVIKRETIIDERSIPQLLGYIYNDVNKIGTDMLPVPSVEVVFYFPEITSIGKEVEMYNGTSVEAARGDGFTSFYDIGSMAAVDYSVTKPRDPNEKYITVKYVNSDDVILKENIIRDMPLGSIYTPELLPNITDKEGKEWILAPNQTPNIKVSTDNAQNVVEVKYVKKISKVKINYINKQGNQISEPVVANFQVGEVFDIETARKFKDASGNEWSLYQCVPSRFVVSDNPNRNILILTYDVVRAEVFVSYKTREGVDLKPQEKISTVANQEYRAEYPDTIVDETGLKWTIGNDVRDSIFVSETELNAIELYYDEKKARVITCFVNEANEKIKDDVVEFVQVGKEFRPKYDTDFVDWYGKYWHLKGVDNNSIIVSEKDFANMINISYEKVTSTIHIALVNKEGQRIKDDIINEAQIGSKFTSQAISEVEDVSGKMWTCVDTEKSLIVSQSEMANKIAYTYVPLMTKVHFQYVNDEGEEILDSKVKEVQVGCAVEPDLISEITSKDQRVWVVSTNNIRSYIAKRHEEENIVKLNYDKKLVKVCISFKNTKGETVKADIYEDAQVGSEYKAGRFDKINADSGERLMIARTEPDRMFVRENSRFTLIYGDIKARVTVKCVNIEDDMSIINDEMVTTKLGGVFVPNVAVELFDRQKRRWKYVGEPAMSIIAKENELENIITLKYEKDKAKVTLKYINNIGQTIHKDVISEEQIGSEIAIKEFDKIIEEDGTGWALKNMSRSTIVVSDNPDQNIVTSNYEPLLSDVHTRYIDNDGNELKADLVDYVQVGKTFKAVVPDQITDYTGKEWLYANIKVEDIRVLEEKNKVNIKYVPYLKNVTLKYIDTDGNTIMNDKVIESQVGGVYNPPEMRFAIDAQGKCWNFKKFSSDNLKVTESETQNLITYVYEKALNPITINLVNDSGVLSQRIEKAQIGSVFEIECPKVIQDDSKLSWIISSTSNLSIIVSESQEQNVFNIKYEKYMISVYEKCVDDAGKDIIDPRVIKRQVGIKYAPQFESIIKDKDGATWEQVSSSDTRIFAASYKIEPIIVSDEVTRNIISINYRPKLVEATMRFVDSVGKQIKPDQVVKAQVGTIFKEMIPDEMVDSLGNKWTFNPNNETDIKIGENPKENLIILTYDEEKSKVTFRYLDKNANDIVEKTTMVAQIGSVLVPQFDTIITDEHECVWEYQERNIEKLVVNEDSSKNIIELTYIPLYVDVLVNYMDLWDKKICEPKTLKAQLGSIYKPTIAKDFTDDNSLQYRLKSCEPSEIKIVESKIGSKKSPNVFKCVFEPIMSKITVNFVDLNRNELKEKETLSVQVGSKYVPEPPEFIKDRRGNEWKIINPSKEPIVVFENPDSNVLNFTYEVAMADVIMRYINMEGLIIHPEYREKFQVGHEFIPKPEEFVVDQSNKKWKLIEVAPINLIVGSINNIVTATYQEQKARITLKCCDENGKPISREERVEAQIGAKFTPKITNKVIYNESEIWRLQRLEPQEITVSENSNENVIKLIYSNAKVRKEEPKKKVLVNPFANTEPVEEKTEEVKEDIGEVVTKEVAETPDVAPKNVQPIDESVNSTNVSETEEVTSKPDSANEPSSEQEAYNEEAVTSFKEVTSANEEFEYKPSPANKEVEFTEANLKGLERSISLTNQEKAAIIDLNEISKEIIQKVLFAREAFQSGRGYDISEIENIVLKEKEIIRVGLDEIIQNDRTGAKLLKILEAVNTSNAPDKSLERVQEKKAIIITDYFVLKSIDVSDKASYICERGKNNEEIKIIDSKKNNKNSAEVDAEKATLYYEKVLLNNYYKARNAVNDGYFTDKTSRNDVEEEVPQMVSNMLIRQAYNILSKDSIAFSSENELEAILHLLSAEDNKVLKEKVNSLEGRQKKIANNLLKEIEKRM